MQVQATSFQTTAWARGNAASGRALPDGPHDIVQLGYSYPSEPKAMFPAIQPEARVSPERVREIASEPNPVVRNLQITNYYHDVAVALRDMIGQEGGNNWPAWACWASKHVGEHIRREDLPFLRGTCKVTTAIARAILPASIHAAIWGPSDAMDRANAAIVKANTDIFRRTCAHFTRFVQTFQGVKEADPQKWAKFAADFAPGTYEFGGEDLLRLGFRYYYDAMFEPDPKKKAELVLLGNCHIVYDEQKHAHDEINEAIPWYAGRPVTSWSLYLDTPTEQLRLGRDLPPRPDGRTYPPHLEELSNGKLNGMFRVHSRAQGVDKDGNLVGSRCHDYRKIEDRMNMIVNVFRTRHDDASLYEAPFTPAQREQIKAGLIPDGKL